MKKVFVFCIGGTGERVMKSITMLMAAGMDTNGFTVVPIIVDPHLDLDEKKNLQTLIDEPTLKSKACLKCLYFTKIISDLCRNLECFSYLYTINQTE